MKRILVPEEGIETLFGSYDENLKHLESIFNVRIRTQGHELLVDGEPANTDRVDRVVGQLSSLIRDGSQGGSNTSSTRQERTSGISWTASTTQPGISPATGQPGAVSVMSMATSLSSETSTL